MTELPVNRIVQGAALDVLQTLPDSCVDMCVTSPPYWALRDYKTLPQYWDEKTGCEHDWNDHDFCNKCHAWCGELGLEPTSDLFIKHLCDIFDEVKRVLKPTGTCWVNLGDTYAGSGKGVGTRPENAKESYILKTRPAVIDTLPAKSLTQIPARFAIEMCNRSWILRNELIWWKPNCMPSSAKDRFTVDFEKVFFFVKSKKYYFETQYEPLSPHSDVAYRQALRSGKQYGAKEPYQNNFPSSFSLNGRNKRCVWRIPTKPLPEAHCAVYPPGLIETPIKAGSPKHGIVLDPFMGSGTTALVALQNRRRFIGIELNQKYVEMAHRRIRSLPLPHGLRQALSKTA